MNRRKTVLIADDSSLIRKILSDSLEDEYNLLFAEDGQEAIDRIQENRNTIALILLDLVMPRLDGFQVLAHMIEYGLLDKIPVIMVTAEESDKYISLAYDMGVCEVIQKPFNRNIIKRRVRNITELYSQKYNLQEIISQQTKSLEKQALKLKETNDLMIDALSTVIEYRSLESGQHIRRIRGFTKILLEYLSDHVPQYHFSADEIDMISGASAMHDIGKIAIPDSVLLKPGKLTPEEFEIMKTHTTKGCEILFHLNQLDNKRYLSYCHEICLWHHERWDGSGYPDHLTGDEIPIAAQVVSIADVYDALTHRRVYKEAYPIHKTVDMILNGKCGAFSPTLLECFEQSLLKFEELAVTYGDIATY